MIKYLYGKKKNFTSLLDGKVSLRFTHISNYARLENENMKDNEVEKTTAFNPKKIRVKFDGFELDSNSILGFSITRKTRSCFCLCLSNRKNSPELFEKFNADICVEVKVDEFVKFLTDYFEQDDYGVTVLARDITYYDDTIDFLSYSDWTDLTFVKPLSFRHEDEFRIAIFPPLHETHFRDENGNPHAYVSDDGENVITMTCVDDPTFYKQFLGEHFCYEKAEMIPN